MLHAANDHEAIAAAGVTSIGIVRLVEYVALPYLESGQLTEVLANWTAEQRFPISVMYPHSRHLSAKVRIFVEWMSELIRLYPIFQDETRKSG